MKFTGITLAKFNWSERTIEFFIDSWGEVPDFSDLPYLVHPTPTFTFAGGSLIFRVKEGYSLFWAGEQIVLEIHKRATLVKKE